MGIIIRNGKQYGFSGKVGMASSVLYDNTNSQIEVATVQEAIDYILENGVSGGGLLEVDLTKVEYEEMVAQDVIVDNVTYYITDDDDEYNASTIVYDNTDTGLESGNVQGAITEINAKVNEQNKNMGGLRFGVDGDGNYGYYGADDSLIPFSQKNVIFVPFSMAINHSQTSKTFDASAYNNGKDTSKAKVYPTVGNIYNAMGSGYTIAYSASLSSDWIITINTSGYANAKTTTTTFTGAVIVFE